MHAFRLRRALRWREDSQSERRERRCHHHQQNGGTNPSGRAAANARDQECRSRGEQPIVHSGEPRNVGSHLALKPQTIGTMNPHVATIRKR